MWSMYCQWGASRSEEEKENTIIHSFNRNFAKRADGNPKTHAFVASPQIVTALALRDLSFNPIVKDYLINDNRKVKLDIPE